MYHNLKVLNTSSGDILLTMKNTGRLRWLAGDCERCSGHGVGGSEGVCGVAMMVLYKESKPQLTVGRDEGECLAYNTCMCGVTVGV